MIWLAFVVSIACALMALFHSWNTRRIVADRVRYMESLVAAEESRRAVADAEEAKERKAAISSMARIQFDTLIILRGLLQADSEYRATARALANCRLGDMAARN